MGARRKARELALQMLFENDVAGTEPSEMFSRSPDFAKATDGMRDFTKRLVSGTLEHRDALDKIISKQADHWPSPFSGLAWRLRSPRGNKSPITARAGTTRASWSSTTATATRCRSRRTRTARST